MVGKRKSASDATIELKPTIDSFTKDLIDSINKDAETKIAYSLTDDSSPTAIVNFISTGSKLLDYAIANKKNGGVPVGRVTEISGMESTGKSLLGLAIIKSVIAQGGIGVLIDTENATSPELLQSLGIDISKCPYVQPDNIEAVFSAAEHIIMKVKEYRGEKPVVIVWDSVAGTPTKKELLGDYDEDTIGLAARKIAQGLRKITQLIGNEKIAFVLINQLKTKIGVMYADPMISYGGKAIPYHSSVRIKLTANGMIEGPGGKEDIIGVGVRAKVIKNKVSIPFRTCYFNILFNIGINETEPILDVLAGARNLKHKINDIDCDVEVTKGKGWNYIIARDKNNNEVLNEKFHKKDFGNIIKKYPEMIDELLDQACVRHLSEGLNPADIDTSSIMEVQAVSDEILSVEDAA